MALIDMNSFQKNNEDCILLFRFTRLTKLKSMQIKKIIKERAKENERMSGDHPTTLTKHSYIKFKKSHRQSKSLFHHKFVFISLSYNNAELLLLDPDFSVLHQGPFSAKIQTCRPLQIFAY